MNLRVGLLYMNRVAIHWGLLIEFSCDPHKTLCNIRLLSALLTILVSNCYNIMLFCIFGHQ